MKKIISGHAFQFSLIVVCLLYISLAFKNLDLPGVYMDSVNPDYLASWFFRGDKNIPAWLYPDNFLAGPGYNNYPLLSSLYGGCLLAYLAAIFFKIVGYGLYELRLFHVILSFWLLVSFYVVLKRWNFRWEYILLFFSFLAIDPTYIYLWRTQYYLQMFPLLFFVLGLNYLYVGLNLARSITNDLMNRYTLVAGIFFGLSAYSYFIYFIYFVSILFLFYVKRLYYQISRTSIKILLIGFLIGWLPYLYAHFSILLNFGFDGYISALKDLQKAYGVVDVQQGGLLDRLAIIQNRLHLMLNGNGVETTIFANTNYSSNLLNNLFLMLVFIGFASAVIFTVFGKLIARRNLDASFFCKDKQLFIETILAIVVSHFILAFIIGKPLSLQHFIMLIPFIWIIVSYGLLITISILSSRATPSAIIFIFITLTVLSNNFISSQKIGDRLIKEGGSGFYSDSLNVAVEYMNKSSNNTVFLFPQWGYWMTFVIRAGSKYDVFESSSLQSMKSKICQDHLSLENRPVKMLMNSEELSKEKQVYDSFLADCHIKEVARNEFVGTNQVEKLILIEMEKK